MLDKNLIPSLEVGTLLEIEGEDPAGLYEYGGVLPSGEHVITPVHDNGQTAFAVNTANLCAMSLADEFEKVMNVQFGTKDADTGDKG